MRVEKRTTVGQDGQQCRPAVHSDGTAYAAFYGGRALTGSFPANTLVITSADVVVVRDDRWGAGGLVNLKEPPLPAKRARRRAAGLSYGRLDVWRQRCRSFAEGGIGKEQPGRDASPQR